MSLIFRLLEHSEDADIDEPLAEPAGRSLTSEPGSADASAAVATEDMETTPAQAQSLKCDE